MRRITCISLLAAALAIAASQPAAKVFPFAYSIDDLPNGLRVVTVPTPFPNIVALYTVVRTGSRNEVEPGKSGFAHLFEHLMFRGTEKFPPEKWEAVMSAAGAQTNAYTTDDRTVYHEVFAKESLDPVLMVEGDRFQNLKYSEAVFKTETRAVLGEYNKNSSNPFEQLFEALQDTAFTRHTYKHTTMGFLRDVESMPNEYDYSLQFFDRWYRPENVIVCLVGDVDRATALPLVKKYFGNWKRGSYKAEIPAEPPQTEPKTAHVDWPSQTLPLVSVSFKAPAYDDQDKDSAVLDIALFQAFSQNSELYRKLVIDEQKVDVLEAENADHTDPFLFTAVARVKNAKDVDYVKQQILDTFESLRAKPIGRARLDEVKSHLLYEFALSMDSTAHVAEEVAPYVGLRRTPETINKRYALYRQITPENVQAAARKYFVTSGRTIATLSYKPGAKAPAGGGQ
ncbi:MAG TPA: pitrilysin family protein [Bryobacterales bacterium]|nr:pitrilysin family protein [Bryobacterales bacterium]